MLFSPLLPVHISAAGSRRGHSHAGGWWRFRRKAHRASSLAHVLWPFRRHRILFPGTATGLPRLATQNKRIVCTSSAAAHLADFLAVSRSVHHCLPEKAGRGPVGSILMSCKNSAMSCKNSAVISRSEGTRNRFFSIYVGAVRAVRVRALLGARSGEQLSSTWTQL